MRKGWVRVLLVVGVAALVMGCSSTPPVARHTPTPPPAATSTPSPAATPPATPIPSARPNPPATPAPTAVPSPAPAAAPAPTAVPSPAPAGAPVLTTLSGADLTTLTSVYLSYVDKPSVYPPGSIAVYRSYAALMPDGGVWAFVQFSLTSATPSVEQQVGMQDGANSAVYLRLTPASTWLLRGIAGNPACNSIPQIGVPSDVATLWGITEPCPQ